MPATTHHPGCITRITRTNPVTGPRYTAAQQRTRVVLCITEAPRKLREVSAALSIPMSSLQNYVRTLADAGQIIYVNGRWMSMARYLQIFKPPPEMPSVNLPERCHVAMPDPITEIIDGVTYTRQAAPAGRWAVTIPPGGGAITQDWMAARQSRARA